jgi:outer membrane protein TolC
MRLSVVTCLAVAAAIAVATPALAQAPISLTLDEAIARALAHAPRLAEARAREAAASAAVTSRTALSRPTLTASAGLLRTNHVEEFGIAQPGGGTRVIFPDLPNNYRARTELAVPLFTAGRVDALVDAARADTRAAAADREATAAEVTLGVTSAYWTLVTERERVAVLQRALARADAVVGDVGARVEAGVLPPNDRLSAEAQRARQRVQLIVAENAALLAESDLARLVGLAPGDPVAASTAVTDGSPAAAEASARPLAELVERARAARPERLALAERQAALRAAADAALAAGRPQVAALAAVEPARPNPRFVPRSDVWHTSWDLGVNVSWSLWDGGRARAEATAASAQAAAVAARVSEFDDLVALEVRQRLLDLAASRAAIAAAEEAVAAATEARRVLGERFAVGVATNTDVLDADVAQLEAELERTRLRASLRLSEARLLRTIGGAAR